jgi:hypothetical protein
VTSHDGSSVLEVTRSLVGHGGFEVPPDLGKLGRGGRYYSKYGIGQSLAAVPLYLVGVAVGQIAATRGMPPSLVEEAAASFLNAFVTAATAVVVFLFAHRLGARTRLAVGCALIYGLGTLAFPYAQSFYSEPLSGLLLLLSALCLLRLEPGSERGNPITAGLLAGMFLGLALLTRFTAGASAAVLVLAVLLRHGWRSGALRRSIGATLACIVPVLCACVVIALYDELRFGAADKTGYSGGEVGLSPRYLLNGLYVLLLSPGSSFLLYSPILVLGAIGFPHLIAQRPFAGWMLLGVAAAHVLLFAMRNYPDNPSTYGPRYLVPAIPFCVLPLAVELPCWTGRARTLAAGALIGTSCLVQWPAVIVHPSRNTFQLIAADPEHYYWRMIRRPADSHFFTLWEDVREVVHNAVYDSGQLRAMARRQMAEPAPARNLDARSVLGVRVNLNAPNVWWLTSYYAGVPAALIGGGVVLLIAVAIVSFALLARELRTDAVPVPAPSDAGRDAAAHHA